MTTNVPPPGLPAGAAASTNFFDSYPRFYETNKTAAARDRLNLRYEAIFGQNRDLFDGARVLDMTSHDGRWSMAALHLGAAEIVGIEGRPGLVANAEENFAHYGVEPSRYSFIAGDIFDVCAENEMKFDVVLCLGFMYHTLRYNELMFHIRQMQPRHVIIDTNVAKSSQAVVRVHIERVVKQRNAIADRYTHGDRVFAGKPSLAALRGMLEAYDFEIERVSDWASLVRDNPPATSVGGYRDGKRVTVRVRSVA